MSGRFAYLLALMVVCQSGMKIHAVQTADKRATKSRHLSDSNTRGQSPTAWLLAGDPVNHSGKVTCRHTTQLIRHTRCIYCYISMRRSKTVAKAIHSGRSASACVRYPLLRLGRRLHIRPCGDRQYLDQRCQMQL